MKLHTPLLKTLCRLFTLAAALVVVHDARAGLAVPYTPNADTLHLWHLNETNGSYYAYDSADLSTNAEPITLTNYGEPTPTTFPFTNTYFGAPGPGFPGLTNAYTGNNKYHVLYGGAYNNVVYGTTNTAGAGLCNPTTGAFTFEAILQMSNALSGDYEIFTGDTGGGITTRGWQWRFNTTQEQWDLLGGGTDNNFTPGLPSSGTDQAFLNTWYHVAVTFTGQSPTNGDPASVLKLYWTPLNPSRTYADVLIVETNVTNAQMPNGIRPLNGAPTGTTEPNIGLGGSSRSLSNPGNNEGLVGSICEVRVTDLCLKSNQMAFTNGGVYPPSGSLPPYTLVGYGQALNLTATYIASPPVTFLWYQNGTNLPSQTTASLSVPSATFANGGSYYLIMTNAYGSYTTSVAQVTVGAVADELFATGIVSNEVSAGGVPDPNYELIQSLNPNYLGPTEMIWESNCPIEIICSSGSWAPDLGTAQWISDQGNATGAAPGDPAGNYIIRTTILLDQASPTNLAFQSGLECDGILSNILINGQSTGFNMPSVAPLYANTISLSNYNNVLAFKANGTTFSPVALTATTSSNWFAPGLNTIDFVLNTGNAGLKIDAPTMIGYALPPGLPTILQQPASETVRDANLTGPGSHAVFSVVATGRSPLTYQWYSNGFVLPGVTTRTLTYTNPAAGLQGTNFQVVVANSSGSVTSQVATLTLSATNQEPVCPPLNLISFNGAGNTVYLSYLLAVLDSDPDGDLLSIPSVAGSSTNGASVNANGTTIVYTPNPGYLGSDEITYAIQDSNGATNEGDINVLDLGAPQPLTTVLVGGTTNLNVGVSNVPAGYSFQWQFYGTNLPGANSAVLVISNAQESEAGPYDLVVSASGTSFTSPTAWLALNGAPMPLFEVSPLDWVFNGFATPTPLISNVLTLTDGALNEARSAWFAWPQDISDFSASFVYRDVGGQGADGFTLTLQNTGTAALGGGGGGLGYLGINSSVALQFNIYSDNTVGIALQSAGNVSPPFTPTTPVNIANGDPIAVNVSYSAGLGKLTLTDLTTAASTSIPFNSTNYLGDDFENVIGTNIAYVGFTGADGAVASTQTISNFVFLPPTLPLAVTRNAPNDVVLSWTPPYSGFLLQSSANLLGPWQYVTNAVSAVSGQYQVTVPLSAGAQFYRLILP